MVKLNKIYTRTGDGGMTGLAAGPRRSKADLRIESFGAVDEANAAIGLAMLHAGDQPELGAMLTRIQNDLFDLGADLATPDTGEVQELAPLRIVETREYDNPAYRRNDGDRCYHCKSELFTVVRGHAAAAGIPHVVDGSNADDVGDYRPGLRARDEQAVRSPLLEAGLDKESVRRFSRALGLPTWDKPAAPCLSSRIPYGTAITGEKLRQVEAAEAGLRELGFRVVRVRHHDQVARVEVPSSELARLLEPGTAAAAAAAVKRAGFLFVAVDLEGFRSGSLNAALAPRPVSLVRLEEIGKLAGQYGAARIVVEGHTDASMKGKVPAALVKELSTNRANSVKQALVRKFPTLSPNQFSATGAGWDEPADPDDPHNHSQNRRVEVKVYPLEAAE